MAILSDETLDFILKRAKNMHHGSITIHINADAASKVDVEVCERERFHTDDQVLPPGGASRSSLGGKSRPEGLRRG